MEQQKKTTLEKIGSSLDNLEQFFRSHGFQLFMIFVSIVFISFIVDLIYVAVTYGGKP